MNVLIVGASAGLGRALAEEMAAKGHRLMLVARDARDLIAVAADLTTRFEIQVDHLAVDLATLDADRFGAQVLSRLSPLDAVFLVAGLADNDDTAPLPTQRVKDLIAANLVAPILIANTLFDHLAEREKAHLVAIGTVASIRGRGRNMVYGSAKRGLEFYFEALRHRMSDMACRVQFYRAGFMATTMLKGRTGLLVASPRSVAKKIVARLDGPEGTAYISWAWAFIGLVLSMLPYFIFRRLRI